MPFFIRQARLEDASTLLKLAKMVHFINLPADLDIIQGKIRQSRQSFAGKAKERRERSFMFVLEDSETGNVIGTSSVIAQISWPGHPQVYFQVRRREHYSEDLQTGAVHVTLQLGEDISGPSELGGLILAPSYRGHKEKLGSFLSLVRFHFIGLHPTWFDDRIMAEMMAPLTPDSRNTLWEYLGRRFINLSYAEADMFCQQSKEFMTSLLPKSEIYISLLPAEARNLIGKVGKETEPAKKMLESLGFKYDGQVDPFDGGPYLRANIGDIALVRDTRSATYRGDAASYPARAFVSSHRDAEFRAVKCDVSIDGDSVAFPSEVADLLETQPGQPIAITPIPGRGEKPARETGKATV